MVIFKILVIISCQVQAVVNVVVTAFHPYILDGTLPKGSLVTMITAEFRNELMIQEVQSEWITEFASWEERFSFLWALNLKKYRSNYCSYVVTMRPEPGCESNWHFNYSLSENPYYSEILSASAGCCFSVSQVNFYLKTTDWRTLGLCLGPLLIPEIVIRYILFNLMALNIISELMAALMSPGWPVSWIPYSQSPLCTWHLHVRHLKHNMSKREVLFLLLK